MLKVNKLTTSFIKHTNATDKARNQYEYNMYASMLGEEELERLKPLWAAQSGARRGP